MVAGILTGSRRRRVGRPRKQRGGFLPILLGAAASALLPKIFDKIMGGRRVHRRRVHYRRH